MQKILKNEFKQIALLSKRYVRQIWSFIIAFISVLISYFSYFKEFPLFGFTFLGESLIAVALYLLIFFFGALAVKALGRWLGDLITRLFRSVLYDFWKGQSKKLVEAITLETLRSARRDKNERESYKVNSQPIVIDTSTLIDGRIVGVVNSGFLDTMFIIPQNVIDELQHMADKSDSLKRQKGRRGLDLLQEIKEKVGKDKFKIVDLRSKPDDVDRSLVRFCKKHQAKMATVDFNLNKAAQVAGVEVLNLNKLANEVKTNILPGEVLNVTLIQAGKEEDQAVAYLEDGTMIVVKNASDKVGKECVVIVEKILQTSAGRMVFAEISTSKSKLKI